MAEWAYLPKVLERQTDLEARVQMQLASTTAGRSFSVAGFGLVLGMSHSLGARVGVLIATGRVEHLQRA